MYLSMFLVVAVLLLFSALALLVVAKELNRMSKHDVPVVRRRRRTFPKQKEEIKPVVVVKEQVRKEVVKEQPKMKVEVKGMHKRDPIKLSVLTPDWKSMRYRSISAFTKRTKLLGNWALGKRLSIANSIIYKGYTISKI